MELGKRGTTVADINKMVDKAYEHLDFPALVDAPVSSLEGVSEADAAALAKAFNIKTIGDLGTNKHFLRAHAIVSLAGGKH